MLTCAATNRPAPAPDDVSLEDKVAFLSRPESYPGPVDTVFVRETHMSFVFMTDGKVYKLKKPVRFPYLDFSTPDLRKAVCTAEFHLNRRLAPDIYLGVLPLTLQPSGLAIGGNGPAVDWLVLMRRLDETTSLESSIRSGHLRPIEVDHAAATLRRFYRHARRIRVSPEIHLVEWKKAITRNTRVLLDRKLNLPAGVVLRIEQTQRRFLDQRRALFASRIRERFIVDGHGDLRPEHIFLGTPPIMIDRLEFDPHLRVVDPLGEVAFLDLECERLGAAWVGRRLRQRLGPALRDDPANGLYLFYRSNGALVRARLAIAHLLDPKPRQREKWRPLAEHYLRLALIDTQSLDTILNRP